jgi:alcohol dehydrogenase (NADP+)
MIGPLAEPMKVSTGPLISRTIGVSGSTIGDPAQIGRMLKLAQDTGIKTWYQKYNFRDINKAFEDFEQGKPRFRIVLVNEENGGKI